MWIKRKEPDKVTIKSVKLSGSAVRKMDLNTSKELYHIVDKMDFLEELYPEEYISDFPKINRILLDKIKDYIPDSDILEYINRIEEICDRVTEHGKLSEEELQTALDARDKLALLSIDRSIRLKDVSDEKKKHFFEEKYISLSNAIKKIDNAILLADKYKSQSILKKNKRRNELYLSVIKRNYHYERSDTNVF